MKYLLLKSGKFVGERNESSNVLNPVTFDTYERAIDFATNNTGKGTVYVMELVPVAAITKEVINKITIDPLVK